MEVDTLLARNLAVALTTGIVLGLERGWAHQGDQQADPGIRTFALVALLGGLLAVFDQTVLLGVGFLGVAVLALLGYLQTSKRFSSYGYTTEVALLIAYVCGATAVSGQPVLAMSAAVVSALALGLKPEIHGLVKRLARLEVIATLQLLVAAVVLLPLLPEEDIWLPGLNFRTIGWFVLLILGLSYLGYASVRILGDRLGVLFTAFFGGLTSSTAVTATLSRAAAGSGQPQPLLVAGVLIACSIMPLRLLLMVGVVNPALFWRLAPALATLAVSALLYALVSLLRCRAADAAHGASMTLSNPLELRPAAIFAAFLTVLFVALPWLEQRFGSLGVYLGSALSGLTDVDALGLTLAQQSNGTLPATVASTGIFIAALANTLMKALISVVASHGRLGWPIRAVLLGSCVAAAGVFQLGA